MVVRSVTNEPFLWSPNAIDKPAIGSRGVDAACHGLSFG
jgi:hypothetical protein